MDSNIRSMMEKAERLPELDLSVDSLEQILIEAEQEIARQRALQLAALELLDRAQVATADGHRNLSEWVSCRLDVGHDTANSLVRTMRRSQQRFELREALRAGQVSFDRVEPPRGSSNPEPTRSSSTSTWRLCFGKRRIAPD